MRPIKCVVVGDEHVDKIGLVISYVENTFDPDCGLSNTYSGTVVVDGKPITLNLHTTSGYEEDDSLLSLTYRQSDVFIICFSLIQPKTLENVCNKWYPEIYHHCPRAPIILVGTRQ